MPINARLPLPRRVRFRLRSILLILILTVLLLPLAALYFFRLYENELVRQTELELIAQSAVLSASYRQVTGLLHPNVGGYGYLTPNSPLIGGKMLPSIRSSVPGRAYDAPPEVYFTPVSPTLALVNPILAPRPPALPAKEEPDIYGLMAGKALQDVLKNTQQVTLVGIRLLDMNGVVVGGSGEVGLSLSHVTEVRQALQGRYASSIRQRHSDEPAPPLYSISRGTNIRVFTAFPVMHGERLQGVVYLSRTPKNILKHLYGVQDKLYLAAALLLSVAIALVFFISSSISRPIRELIEQTQRVVQGEQRAVEPLTNPVTHEVAQLSDSFAAMSKALADRADYINRFATHVSHEFKTPLTSMQGALELLQEHMDSMPAERRQRFLDNLVNDTQRLKDLVSRLLELARADALGAIHPSKQSTTWPAVLQGLMNLYRERGLIIALASANADDHAADSSAEPITVNLAIASDALETVLTNLLDNSLYHGADRVDIHTRCDHETFIISLHDNGEGISPANRERIFTPFFTTRRNTGGTGLGLEISQSLLKAYNGHITLGSSTQGAEFILYLPAADSDA